MVVEDHGSTKGVISKIPGICHPYNDDTTTIPLRSLNKRHELSDKFTSDRKTHFVLHKYEQLHAPKGTANTAHDSAQQKLKNHISIHKGLSEKSKKLSILRNHHPEFLEPLPESTEKEEYLIKSTTEEKDPPNEKVALLENISKNQNRIYRPENLCHQENRLILTRYLPSVSSTLPNYGTPPGIQSLIRSYWHPCLKHDSPYLINRSE
jgi:hypothetical protein